ncbi:major facilitator superfamily protein [Ilyonectria sp. MPI-CAGE-AT-0026]|nr:major facilitator superfamily protein [Ilyonectria sp. MPI-CAGE-AT-0026]
MVGYRSGDPIFEFDAEAERKLRSKIDWNVVPLVSIVFLLCFLDRTNIGNARLANFEEELNLQGYDFNIALTVYYIPYILLEIPANVFCKYIGPGWFIPLSCIGFGVITIATGFVNNLGTLCLVRFLLGLFEAGMLPATVYYLSRWYRRDELTFRMCFFILSASLAGAFGGLLASAILLLDGFGTVHSWRMIFVIEGTITSIIGVIALFTMTDRADTARWLNDNEKKLAVERVTSERVGHSPMTDTFNWTKFRRGMMNPVVIPTAFIFLFNNITVQGLAVFLPTVVATIFPEAGVVKQQLLTVPPYILGTIACTVSCFLSWKWDNRMNWLVGCAAPSILGYIIFIATDNGTARYVATFLPMCGVFTYGATTAAHVSNNALTDTGRSAGIGMHCFIGSIGSLISTWSFLKTDAPHYHIGNGINLASQSTMCVIAMSMLLWINHDNKKRDERGIDSELAGRTQLEIEELEWRHPQYRWIK